jgi:hypothetical protein
MSKDSDAQAVGIARVVTDEINDGGPICIKCIATARGLPRGAVETAVAALRRALVIDSVMPCRVCASRETLTFGRVTPYDGRPR